MTPRTPGLDPERAATAAAAVKAAAEDKVTLTWAAVADAALAADDTHARSRGLVCQGDGLTREVLLDLIHNARCALADPGVRREWARQRKAALNALAALPSSLLDNPEADR